MGRKKSKYGSYDSVTDFFLENYTAKTSEIKTLMREFDKEYPGDKGTFRRQLKAYVGNYYNKGYHADAKKLEKLLSTVDRAEYDMDDEGDNSKCSNANCGSEKDFEKYIEALLDKDGYKILDRNDYNIREEITYIPDIVCLKGNVKTVVEVKKCLHNHRLFTAIGQLTYHRAVRPPDKQFQYQYIVALPDFIFNEIQAHFAQHVKDKFDIQIKPYKWK